MSIKPKSLHQFLAGATKGDAITSHAFILRKWLREMGIQSEIYAEHIHESVADEIYPHRTYRPKSHEKWVIYHHSLGSAVADFLLSLSPQLILIHHNVTPPEFFADVNPDWVRLTRWGQEQLRALHPRTALALADSAFNEAELKALAFPRTGVLSIILEMAQYDLPLNAALAEDLRQRGPKLLFIGRFSPNKKQEDLVKLLYFYRRIQPDAELILVGDPWVVHYDTWIELLAADLGLSDAVTLAGKVSQQDMVTYYKTADVYVSMSEHEGFGKPLIESMYLELPILAYASTSVPYTLNKTGLLFHEKDYERLAELVDILVTDQDLRQRVIAHQRQRLQTFLEPQVQQQFRHYLGWLFDCGQS